MRLLRTSSAQQPSGLQLVEFDPSEIPPYAILSHTWGRGEVLYHDVINGTATHREAFQKVHDACLQALEDGYDYIWIDTCCIDKTSSAELSEAINSMFALYHDSNVCYVFLSDLADEEEGSFAQCRWWTRGWTLQELIAPKDVLFFNRTWTNVGDKCNLAAQIADITRINEDILTGKRHMETASVANRMGWASRRNTTRPEDMAYCLMGIFSVNMPLLYGEGMRAFTRLQEEIMKYSTDQTLFAWVDKDAPDEKEYGLLAPSPHCFETTHNVISYDQQGKAAPYTMTNEGISIQMPVRDSGQIVHNGTRCNMYRGYLDCPPSDVMQGTFLVIYLVRNGTTENGYARIKASTLDAVKTAQLPEAKLTSNATSKRQRIYVRPRPKSRRPNKDSLYPWHHIFLTGQPPTRHYKLLTMCRMADLPNPSVQEMGHWGSECIIIRRGAGKVSLMSVFERISDNRLLLVAVGNLDLLRLAFWAEEVCATPNGIAPIANAEMSQGKGKGRHVGISSSTWMGMQERFQPTPMGETLRLPGHVVTINSRQSMKLSTRDYLLEWDIKPDVDMANSSEASSSVSKGEKGGFKRLLCSWAS